MGLRLRKSFNLGGGARINLSKSGIGGSIGTKGVRLTKMSNGKTRNTMSIPGTGISYVTESGSSKSKKVSQASKTASSTKQSSKYLVNKDGTVTIRGNTYKVGVLKFTRFILYFASIFSLLLIPVFPIFLLVSIFFGYNGYKYGKIIKASRDRVIVNSQTNTNYVSTALKINKGISFKARGVSHKNDCNVSIQTIIKTIVNSIKDNLDKEDLYEGKSNAEIADDLEFDPNGKVFELNYETIDDLKLIPEPTNPYDPNAIKIVSDEFGHLGYVPKEMTQEVFEKMKNENHTVTATITGGKYKYYDENEEKVITDAFEYGLEIEVA